MGKPVIVRRPVIPGYNDAAESLDALARFVRQLETVPEINLPTCAPGGKTLDWHPNRTLPSSALAFAFQSLKC